MFLLKVETSSFGRKECHPNDDVDEVEKNEER